MAADNKRRFGTSIGDACHAMEQGKAVPLNIRAARSEVDLSAVRDVFEGILTCLGSERAAGIEINVGARHCGSSMITWRLAPANATAFDDTAFQRIDDYMKAPDIAAGLRNDFRLPIVHDDDVVVPALLQQLANVAPRRPVEPATGAAWLRDNAFVPQPTALEYIVIIATPLPEARAQALRTNNISVWIHANLFALAVQTCGEDRGVAAFLDDVDAGVSLTTEPLIDVSTTRKSPWPPRWHSAGADDPRLPDAAGPTYAELETISITAGFDRIRQPAVQNTNVPVTAVAKLVAKVAIRRSAILHRDDKPG